MRLSKLIRKVVRQALRKWQSERVEQVLVEFENLQRLEHLQRAPILRAKCVDVVEPESFAELLQSVYESESTPDIVNREQIQQVPLFELHEFSTALKYMKKGRGPDTFGITLEMIKLGSPLLHTLLVDMFNDMLLRGYLDPSWHNTIFQMLPKSGDLKDPSNWRPIAILPVIYKIFSKMVCNRLRGVLNEYQPDDQYAFRPNRNINDVFIILESMIGKCMQYDTPLWMVSIDLRKAFDKIEFSPLLDALRVQGISEPYVQLISELYSKQWGCVKGSTWFRICRGVKQGDVISPLLFNAALEVAFQAWKERLTYHGILLADDAERLTNIRYADDVMLYAKSLEELHTMLTMLMEELEKIGLHLNSAKTKILSTVQNVPHFLDVAGNFYLDIAAGGSSQVFGQAFAGCIMYERANRS